MSPRTLLHAEGAALLGLSLYLYAWLGGNWLLFIALLFVPDIGMLGYARSTRLGALTYNLCHTEVVPAAVAFVGLGDANVALLSLALVWFAHIGLDRLLGFGLKYATAFRDTHLGRV